MRSSHDCYFSFGGANDDDEEEAREQRRRAREERKKMREAEMSGTTDVIDTNRYGVRMHRARRRSKNRHAPSLCSVSEADPATAAATDDDQVLLDRLAKREERRQKRMKEAQDRQKENDVSETNGTENDSSLQHTDKEEEEPAGEEDADVHCRTVEEDKGEDEKVKKKKISLIHDKECLI